VRVIGWLGDYSACGHYRLHLPFREHGWGITDRAITDADVIVAQRCVTEVATTCFQRVCADDTTTAVLELDDDLLHLDPGNPAYRYYSDPPLQRRLIDNITRAQLVTVATEPLAQVCLRYTDSVVVLPNYIPEELLDIDRPARDRVVIGWAGTATHSRDFGELAKPLRRVLQKYGDRVEFHCLGADHTHRVQSRRGHTRFTGWVDVVEDYYNLVDFGIGLAPLFPSPFNDCKSDLRLKELAAFGIPTIASDFGPYATAMQQGCPAVPARSHKDWERALCELVDDAERRVQLGKQARAWATQHTIEANAYQWKLAYEAAEKGPREVSVAADFDSTADTLKHSLRVGELMGQRDGEPGGFEGGQWRYAGTLQPRPATTA
jgi:glycosyltransferase involved in cell wall biosynthesis